jgi:hypothetical protein
MQDCILEMVQSQSFGGIFYFSYSKGDILIENNIFKEIVNYASHGLFGVFQYTTG